MKKTVKIAVILPLANGKSQTTGESWERQDIVVKWEETNAEGQVRTQYLLGSLKGESLDLFRHCDYGVDDELEVEIDFNTASYGHKVFNNVNFRLYAN